LRHQTNPLARLDVLKLGAPVNDRKRRIQLSASLLLNVPRRVQFRRRLLKLAGFECSKSTKLS
jgi:hypothetical protein